MREMSTISALKSVTDYPGKAEFSQVLLLTTSNGYVAAGTAWEVIRMARD